MSQRDKDFPADEKMDKAKLKTYSARTLKKPQGSFEEPHWALDPPKVFENSILEVFKTEGVILKRLYLASKGPYFVFGRAEDCTTVLEHPSISRYHAALVHCAAKEAGGVFEKVKDDAKEIRGLVLVDLHSSHGTFLNKSQLTPGLVVLVYDNDIISFGGSSRQYKVKGLGMSRPKVVESVQEVQEETADTRERKRQLDSKQEEQRNVRPKSGPQVRVRHILVKHKDSRRPASWKEEKVTRSEAEALTMIQQFRQQIIEGTATFEEIAGKESHCSSYKRGGDLGFFGKGSMQPPFETAAFDLEVHELSDPVSTQSGVHLILRIG